MVPEGFSQIQSTQNYDNYDDYLLERLNEGDGIEELDIASSAERVSGGFVRSELRALHNGPRKKVLASAFHIPRQDDGSIHHFDLHIVQFTRNSQEEPWEKGVVGDIRNDEVQELLAFIEEQNELIGRVPRDRHFTVLSTDKPVSLQDLDFAIGLVLENDDIDFSNLGEQETTSLVDLVNQALTGNNELLERQLLESLVNERINPEALSNYEGQLRAFTDLVNDQGTIETDMQDFLEDKVWFFGLNYYSSERRSQPRFASGLGSEYDFLLEGFNQVYDIAELKSPNTNLIEEHTRGERERGYDDRIDYRYSKDFGRALHQVTKYLDEFEENFDHITENQPSIKPFMYPKGVIVISKRGMFPDAGGNSEKYLHLLNRQFANIDVLTYDDLADRGRIIVEFLRTLQGTADSEDR